MKKLSCMFLSLVLAITALCSVSYTAYADTTYYDTTFIQNNINTIKNYVRNNGDSKNGTAVWGRYFSDGVDDYTAYFKVDNKNVLTFEMELTYYYSYVTAKIETVTSGSVVIEVESHSNRGKLLTSTAIDPNTYDGEMDLNFSTSENADNYSAGTILDYANKRVRASFECWNLLLSTLQMTMASVGFHAYCDAHNFIMTTSANPTCVQEGYTNQICTKCGLVYSKSIPATGHTYVVDPGVPASYAGNGLTEGCHCSVCGAVIVAQQTIPKLTVPKTSLKSVDSKSRRAATVTWKKNNKVNGYQVQYSTSSKFKGAKSVNISKKATTSKTINNLQSKKKYYVRIRSYKTIQTQYGKVKVYSGWSKAKTVTIR